MSGTIIHDEHSDEYIMPYIQGLKDLEKHEPDFIVMVCNTIHFYHEKLQKEIGVPLMDIRKEVVKYIEDGEYESFIVLVTPVTIKGGLYRTGKIRQEEIHECDIRMISEAIFNFNKGKDRDIHTNIVRDIAREYYRKYREMTFILGCTELSIMLKDEPIPTINTMEILVNSVMERFIQKR